MPSSRYDGSHYYLIQQFHFIIGQYFLKAHLYIECDFNPKFKNNKDIITSSAIKKKEFYKYVVCVCVCVLITQLCPTLCDPRGL